MRSRHVCGKCGHAGWERACAAGSDYRGRVFGNRFFSSFEAGEPQPKIGQVPAGCAVEVGVGPAYSPTANTEVGFTGLRALRYTARGFVRVVLFDVHIPVTERTELSYVVFPEAGPPADSRADAEDRNAARYAGTHVAIDVEFDDGSTLGGLGGKDQYGVVLTALAQGNGKTLLPDQWNRVRCELGELATGRIIRAIVLTVDPPGSSSSAEHASVSGWLDDVQITAPAPRERTSVVDWVRTTRGTHSSKELSRGNTFPATALPHGFNLWTPVTNSATTRWLYEYHRGADARNRPALEALALSHQPSPWIGDRHTFQVMPGIGSVTASRRGRALSFDHAHEVDRPHHYGVRFDNGIVAEIAPTDHAAMFRFQFPQSPGWLLFDNVNNHGRLRLDVLRGTLTGYTSVGSWFTASTRRMFIYAELNRPAVAGGKLWKPGRIPRRKVTGYLAFDTAFVTMRMATSLISVSQAKHNLALEIPAGDTFEEVRDRARRRWEELLGRVEIEGATDDQRTSFYSSLYRMFLYPSSGHENTGTSSRPRYQHASPIRHRRWLATRNHTGAKVVDGPIYVNNGFWDTYRTVWPAYTLLAPSRCAELIEGFLAHYHEGGWLPRWSAPGYRNLMPGTSSDVAFADAYVKGVRGFDVEAVYGAALKNATVCPPRKAVGRQGLAEAIFLGYTPTSTPEGLSWTLEGCVNDFGIAQLSAALYEQCADEDPRRREYADNARYFAQRALNYARLFDPRIGFFQGRSRDGGWRRTPEKYDPTEWGYDYAETNGWNMAFSVPHDGRGLANLFGGQPSLESTLDRFFNTPETGHNRGSYGKVIHEMREARDIRLGQYGHSNQPAHHIPYMYHHAGAPSKAQAIVREVLARCYLGNEIGQGYPGDEDNGEMSAWYVFSALGLYPLSVGSPHYVLGSPLFTTATVHLENGNDLVINAPVNAKDSPYVAEVSWNGTPHRSTAISHETLLRGGVLNFTMASAPSSWGRDMRPPALTTDDQPPTPLAGLSGRVSSSDGTEVGALVDHTARTQVHFRSATPTLECLVDGSPGVVEIYTLTSGSGRGDPRAWTLEGSLDGIHWTVLDERREQVFRWRRQTRPFSLAKPGSYPYARYRLRITESTTRRLSLSQWELLAGAAHGH